MSGIQPIFNMDSLSKSLKYVNNTFNGENRPLKDLNYKYITEFKKTPLQERIDTSNKIMQKYTNRVPISVDCTNKIELDKKKYIVSIDLTIGEFLYTIKKRIKLESHESIFLLTNNMLLNNTENINSVYSKFKAVDGFLYIIISKENVFGISFQRPLFDKLSLH